jgi:hypothetical protein
VREILSGKTGSDVWIGWDVIVLKVLRVEEIEMGIAKFEA